MARRRPTWPLVVLALPAAVSIWAGWVGLGQLTGFGEVQLLPGIWDGLRLDTAITLPVGMEAYAAYALGESLRRDVPARAKRFARRSAMAALVIGCLGQIAFHLMQAAHVSAAPWPITMLVSCLPVGVLGMGAALHHLLDDAADDDQTTATTPATPAREPVTPVATSSPSPAPVWTPPTPAAPLRAPFQVVPNLTTFRPAASAEVRPEPAPAGRHEHQPAGRSVAQPTDRPGPSRPWRPLGQPPDRPDPTPTSRPAPSAAGRPADLSTGRPETAARRVPSRRPAGSRRARKRGARARTDEQLAPAVRELAIRNGGAVPSQYQVRRSLGVGSGRAARLVAAYEPSTSSSSESGEVAP